MLGSITDDKILKAPADKHLQQQLQQQQHQQLELQTVANETERVQHMPKPERFL